VGQVDRVGYAPPGTESRKCHVSRSFLCSTPLDGGTVAAETVEPNQISQLRLCALVCSVASM
jgi:hypothetical protein